MTAIGIEISREQVRGLISYILDNCQGPQEAYALLVAGLLEINQINAKITGDELSRIELAAQVSLAITSVEKLVEQ